MTDPVIMPLGATPGGLPYPEDTDQVMMGAQAIKALATAIEAQPWISFARWTQGTVGATADAPISGWDLTEGNFAANDASGGFTCPKSGLWAITLDLEFSAAWPAGNTLMSVGVKTSAVPPRELFLQRAEPNSAGAVRRCYSLSGMLRIAAGETCRAFMNNATGSSIQHSSGVTANDRHSTRFSARWVAP